VHLDPWHRDESVGRASVVNRDVDATRSWTYSASNLFPDAL
jgi:hypothetical protein